MKSITLATAATLRKRAGRADSSEGDRDITALKPCAHYTGHLPHRCSAGHITEDQGSQSGRKLGIRLSLRTVGKRDEMVLISLFFILFSADST